MGIKMVQCGSYKSLRYPYFTAKFFIISSVLQRKLACLSWVLLDIISIGIPQLEGRGATRGVVKQTAGFSNLFLLTP